MPVTDPNADMSMESGATDIGISDLAVELDRVLQEEITRVERKRDLLQAIARRVSPRATQPLSNLYAALAIPVSAGVFDEEDFST